MTNDYCGHDLIPRDIDRVWDEGWLTLKDAERNIIVYYNEGVSQHIKILESRVEELEKEPLLEKYMKHIINYEGVSFVSHIEDAWGSEVGGFTSEEIEKLSVMAKRLRCNHEL